MASARNPITRLIEKIRGIEYEPEYEEQVEHDTVMVLGPDGKLIDRTEGDYDPEIRQ